MTAIQLPELIKEEKITLKFRISSRKLLNSIF